MNRKQRTVEKWISEYYDAVLRISVRMVENRDDALDCTQEVFIKAWRHFHQYSGEAHPLAWLKTITMTSCYNFLNRNKTRHWDSVEHDSLVDDTNNEGEERFDKRYLRVLSNMERSVIIARVYEDMSFKDVAKSLKTTDASARVLYHNAVKKLKKAMT